MARIVYGFSGEGNGHSSRAREIAAYLLSLGHDVRLVSYDRGFENLKDEFDVIEIQGLTIASSDNRVSRLKTIQQNLLKIPAGIGSVDRMRSLFSSFYPDAVICDFEPMTAYLAEHYQVPLISLDNQHRMRYVQYAVPPGLQAEDDLTRRLIRAMVPWPSVSLVTAFVDGPTKNDRTFVFPPLVRKEVRDCLSTIGQAENPTDSASQVLVYLTSGFDSLLSHLGQLTDQQFVIYGYDRNDQQDNLRFFKSSRDGFLEHLSSCKAVIATAGFTLISEALYLGKPYFALPMKGQYEQELNAWQLSQSGYGDTGDPNVEPLRRFLDRLPDYRRALQSYPKDDGQAIKDRLRQLLANNAAQAKRYRNRRNRGR